MRGKKGRKKSYWISSLFILHSKELSYTHDFEVELLAFWFNETRKWCRKIQVKWIPCIISVHTTLTHLAIHISTCLKYLNVFQHTNENILTEWLNYKIILKALSYKYMYNKNIIMKNLHNIKKWNSQKIYMYTYM